MNESVNELLPRGEATRNRTVGKGGDSASRLGQRAQHVQRPRDRRKPGAWGQTGEADRGDPGPGQGSELTTAQISQLAGGQPWGREVTSPRCEIGGGEPGGWSVQTRMAGLHWETARRTQTLFPPSQPPENGWAG